MPPESPIDFEPTERIPFPETMRDLVFGRAPEPANDNADEPAVDEARS
jgi:hypothetical protein